MTDLRRRNNQHIGDLHITATACAGVEQRHLLGDLLEARPSLVNNITMVRPRTPLCVPVRLNG